MNTYVWCEDSSSGYQFWKEIFAVLYPDFLVETKTNNTRLRQAVERIENDSNVYYILMDMAADNSDVIREVRKLQQAVEVRQNVHLIKIHSFEFSLLSFEKLEQWVFTENDELKTKRMEWLEARKALIQITLHGGEAKDLDKIKSISNKKDKNTEHLAADVLFQITRNTGFETNKSIIGPCFITSCCEWTGRKSDDICGLDGDRLTADEKKKQLVDYSVLKGIFEEAGLYDNNL